MDAIKKLLAVLDPFKQLITVVLFLGGAAYGAIQYFATAQQLQDARAQLERQQSSRHAEAIGALRELRCLTELNRRFLRAEIREFQLSTLLDKNLSKASLLEDVDNEFARVELASLQVGRDSLVQELHDIKAEKNASLQGLGNGTCSNDT